MFYQQYKLINAHYLRHIFTERVNKNVQIPQDQLVVKICNNEEQISKNANYRNKLYELVQLSIAIPN